MSNEPHILVIDDELQIQRAIRTILTEKGFKVTAASQGKEGLALAAANEPDLIILDLGLPDMDGIEVCAQLREWTQTPIVVLSVRDDERDKVSALDKGADDYLTKPFGIEELLARVRVALRHAVNRQGAQNKIIRAGNLTIDLVWHIIKRGEEEIKLTGTEYKLLAYLASNHGRVLTHQNILAKIWGPADADHTEYLRVYMRQLRKKLEADPERPKHILTEPGIGYRFIADE
ncbi:MAG: response regulator [Anaerolineales bacterium]|nr:response regulator [Anaerolineales bacterium]MCZ2122801.1 response regulator [Anaerolineales bacterium]